MLADARSNPGVSQKGRRRPLDRGQAQRDAGEAPGRFGVSPMRQGSHGAEAVVEPDGEYPHER